MSLTGNRSFVAGSSRGCWPVADGLLLKAAYAKASAAEGGERGIRTLGTVSRTTVFETVTIDRSAISPGRGLGNPIHRAESSRGAANVGILRGMGKWVRLANAAAKTPVWGVVAEIQ